MRPFRPMLILPRREALAFISGPFNSKPRELMRRCVRLSRHAISGRFRYQSSLHSRSGALYELNVKAVTHLEVNQRAQGAWWKGTLQNVPSAREGRRSEVTPP